MGGSSARSLGFAGRYDPFSRNQTSVIGPTDLSHRYSSGLLQWCIWKELGSVIKHGIGSVKILNFKSAKHSVRQTVTLCDHCVMSVTDSGHIHGIDVGLTPSTGK